MEEKGSQSHNWLEFQTNQMSQNSQDSMTMSLPEVYLIPPIPRYSDSQARYLER